MGLSIYVQSCPPAARAGCALSVIRRAGRWERTAGGWKGPWTSGLLLRPDSPLFDNLRWQPFLWSFRHIKLSRGRPIFRCNYDNFVWHDGDNRIAARLRAVYGFWQAGWEVAPFQ